MDFLSSDEVICSLPSNIKSILLQEMNEDFEYEDDETFPF